MYFNIPESNCEEAADRMKNDFQLLNRTYENLELKPEDISTLFRVGKKIDDKTRPLVVKFTSLEKKKDVLFKSGKLKLKYNNEICEIFVSIDRTPKQREENKKLVEQLKKKREDEEDEDWVIRNNKIVKNFRDANQTTRVKWADLFQH